jgi:elongation factor P--(R)-beta-lysine ligase
MYQESNKNNWQPTAKNAALHARAEFYQKIRGFFAARNVLEVETPLMAACGVTDPYIQAFPVKDKYLQTSPEYAMKRMLAADCGSIYQICKAFRMEEAGNFHNPEFTMIEWYRLGFDHLQLMQETDELLQLLLDCPPANRITYHDLCMQKLGINPLTADLLTLQQCATQHGINLTATAAQDLTITDWLQLIMSHVIEPQLTGSSPWFVYDFPAAQAALAKVIPGEFPVAARFEVYMEGLELGNGYYELQDPQEQSKRFAADNQKRAQEGIATMQPDERLVAALEVGLPDCAGIAMGIDRMLMLKLKTKNIADVISFTINNA